MCWTKTTSEQCLFSNQDTLKEEEEGKEGDLLVVVYQPIVVIFYARCLDFRRRTGDSAVAAHADQRSQWSVWFISGFRWNMKQSDPVLVLQLCSDDKWTQNTGDDNKHGERRGQINTSINIQKTDETEFAYWNWITFCCEGLLECMFSLDLDGSVFYSRAV